MLVARGVQVQGRAAAEVSSRTEARRALRAAAAPLTAELRHALVEDDAALSLAGDTLRIRTLVSSGMACVAYDGRLALVGGTGDPPPAAWRSLPDSRDALRILQPYAAGSGCDAWGETTITAATQGSVVPAPCTLPAGGRAQLVTPSVPLSLAPGDTVPVQLLRRVAWRLTNSADGWYLSRSRCDGAASGAGMVCDPSQPVAGPFLSPAAGGMLLTPLAAGGAPLPAANQAGARAVELQLAAPVRAARPGASTVESLTVALPLPRRCP